ncbi:hypothetical protein [Sedimentibacter sp. B4]|uniref:hypothetical protein n=1 Tax=Sedimentibacter sp. B4 TaxID=304766 RepID=UPI00030D621B|nr:hypothetical protein [Sedimentibacter sp. B4]
MKENLIEIKFSDYFKATLPRYKSINDLNRKKSYYLSNVHDKLDNYINNINFSNIPKNILDDILVVDLQKYDTMIDIDGSEYDWSGDKYYEPVRTTYEIECLDWYTKKLTAVNHIIFDDILDIESSIIYNLIEITPISEISVEYLRYYFWHKPWTIQDIDKTEGKIFLDKIYNKFSKNIAITNGGYEKFIYTCELLNESYMVIDKFEKHRDIISLHYQYLSEQKPNKSKVLLQSQFGSPLYQNLEKLEKQMPHRLITQNENPRNFNSYTGFLTLLEEGQSNFANVKSLGGNDITIGTIFNYPLACEIFIRAKMKLINRYIKHDDTLYYLINEIKSGIIQYLKKDVTENEKNIFLIEMDNIREIRNYGGHTSKKIPIDKAQKIIDLVCSALRKIDDYFI